jgi:hypothetical protein
MTADVQQPTQADFAQWAEAVVLLAKESKGFWENIKRVFQSDGQSRARCERCLEYCFMNKKDKAHSAEKLDLLCRGAKSESWFFAGSWTYEPVIYGVIEKIDSFSEKTK